MELSDIKALGNGAHSMLRGTVPGRILYIDGDCLAYSCGGGEDSSPASARYNANQVIRNLLTASGAETYKILLTGSGGHKGHRYAIARTKPYQGQRVSVTKPPQWRYLRQLLETGALGEFLLDFDREADDRFGQFGWADPENTVICTADKDMRAIPGHHLGWRDLSMFYLLPDTYSEVFNDKQYGWKWFWLQMLHGDTADNIPGLPLAYGKKCGEVTAGKLLRDTQSNEDAVEVVRQAYESCYGDSWAVNLSEQACLLWMRSSSDACWEEAIRPGGPLKLLWEAESDAMRQAFRELSGRVQRAKEINDLAAKAIAAGSVEG